MPWPMRILDVNLLHPEEIPEVNTWLDGGDTGVISGYLLPLFQIPTELITETLGGEDIVELD